MELYENYDFPCFPKKALKHTPSSASGMPAEEESKMRRKITEFISSFGSRKLRYPRITIATASVFFHRYYARYPYEKMAPVEATALACLLLAGKAEGTIVKIRNFCTLYHQYKGAPAPMHDSKVAKIFEGNLARQEARVLEANEFTLWVEHPYKFFFALLREMLLSGSGHARTKALGKQGYNLITDSFSTNLCIHYSPQEIATAVLHMLTKHHRITMAPLPISPFIPWYMALCEEVFLNFRDKKVLKCLLFQLSEEDLENISSTIVSHSNSNIAKDISAAKKAALDNLEAPPSVTPPLPPAVPLPPAPPPPPPTPPITSDRLLGNKGMDSKHDQRRHTSVPPPPTFHAPVRNQPYAYSSARHAHAYSSASQAHAYSSTTRVYTPERHQSRATNGGHRIQQPWPPGVYHAAGYPSLNGRPNQHMGTVGAGAKRRADGMNPYASRGMPSASTFDRGTRQRASSSKRTKLISGTADARSRGKISSGRRNQYYA